MMEVKDPEIKLFGMKIVLPETGDVLPVVFADDMSESGGGVGGVRADGSSSGSEGIEYEDQQEDDKDQNPVTEESENRKASSESENNPRSSSSTDEDSPTIKLSDTENEQNDASNSEQKPLKKPDKIIPCPRCNSMDTKFCYYNNYNVNQPRHFCKSCQRYWTAGGTMRNVPVGAGRRKNKNFASNCRHIMVSEALQVDHPNGFHHPTFKTNGTVLSFGSDSPLCESMASGLNLAENKAPNGIRNGFYNLEHKNSSSKGGNNVDDCSSVSSISTSNTMVHKPVMQTINGFPSPVPCLPGVPWPFPCDVAVPLPVPIISPVGLPMQLCPVPYWNCNVPGPWSNPWLSPSAKASGSDPISPLGKHSREGDLLMPNNPERNKPLEKKNTERSILVPKTLRIDDPDEAAKSSIWSTLGIKYESVSRGGLFKALQQKSDDKDNKATTSLELNANPAALSRSLSFQERA